MELHRIVPAMAALLEYEWLHGITHLDSDVLDQVVDMIRQVKKITNDNKLFFWLKRARPGYMLLGEADSNINEGKGSATYWEDWLSLLICPHFV